MRTLSAGARRSPPSASHSRGQAIPQDPPCVVAHPGAYCERLLLAGSTRSIYGKAGLRLFRHLLGLSAHHITRPALQRSQAPR